MGLAAVPGTTSTGTTPPALDPVIAEQEDLFLRRQPRSAAIGARARAVARGRRHVELADRPAAGGVAQPRARVEDLRRRRHGVRRPARRVRRVAGRPRAPGDRAGRHRAGRPRHPLRAAHRGRAGRGRGAGPPVRPAAVAVRQLRHRGDHGRGAPDARRDRARPRSSRWRAATTATTTRCEVSVLPEADEAGPPERPIGVARQHRHPAGVRRPGRGRRLQRRRRRWPGCSTSTPAGSPG